MRRVILAIILSALVLTGLAPSAATADTRAPDAETAGDCDTWQYKVTFRTKILKDSSADETAGWAYKGYYFNRDTDWDDEDVDYQWGSWYDHNKNYIRYGGMEWDRGAEKWRLDYITCW